MSHILLLDNSLDDLSFEKKVAKKHNKDLIVLNGDSIEEAEQLAVGAEVLLSQSASFPVTRKMVEAMAPDGYILKYGVGYDKIDIEAALERNIQIAHIPDGTTDMVAEHTVAMILSQLRRLFFYDQSIRNGDWDPTLNNAPIRPFSEVTIGLVGFGRIGKKTYEKLKPLGFQFAMHDPYIEPTSVAPEINLVSLNELAEESQILSLHLAETPETTKMINSSILEKLGPEGFVVNTSRAAIIDEDALVNALRSKLIAGAALDAFLSEPIPADSPLFKTPNLQLSPHAAFYSRATDKQVQCMLSEELDRALSGNPLRCPIKEME